MVRIAFIGSGNQKGLRGPQGPVNYVLGSISVMLDGLYPGPEMLQGVAAFR